MAVCLDQAATIGCQNSVPDFVSVAADALELAVIGEGYRSWRVMNASVRSDGRYQTKKVRADLQIENCV